MRSRLVEVPGVLVQDGPQVCLAHDQNPIQTLAAQAADQALTDGVRTWRANRRSEEGDPGPRRDRVEAGTVFRIIVAVGTL